MRRICKYCGAEYDGDPGSSACPDCAARVKKSVLGIRVCRQCGISFSGGPRAFYCPECRALRAKESAARQRKYGTARPLGSVDQCVVCGKDYVVSSGTQKYCPACAPDAVRKIDRAQSTAWNKAFLPPSKRKRERDAAAAEIKCAVCGKSFVPHSAAITCSRECSVALAKRRAAEFEAANRASRNQYHADARRRREAAMSPDEYRAYREQVNARARENYKKRKRDN